jgi:hypothetical protein
MLCWSILEGIAPAQQDQHQPLNQPAPGPAARANPACWPAPCVATEDPDAKHDFENYLTPPRMRWYAEFDAEAIQGKPQDNVLLGTQGQLGASVLQTHDFAFDLQGAGRVLVGCTLDECFQVEGVYTRINTSENTESFRSPPNTTGGTGELFTPFGGFGATPVPGVDFANFGQINYASSFQGAELNLRRQMPCPPGRMSMSILGGIRYAEIDEDFQFNTQITTPAATNNFHVTTDNQMVGAQIGALFELYLENRWWIDCEMKGAIFSNRMRLNTDYHNVSGGAATDVITSDEEIHTSFAEELTVSLVYRWSAHIATRVGYEAVFVQDVALAPDNLNTNLTIIQQGPAVVSHNQNMIYMGPMAGIMMAW